VERPTLLVVDDLPVDRKLVEAALSEDYEITTASSGAEALELITTRLFDAALVDIQMPEMDGLTVLREIKRHDAAVEVVIMTADPRVDTAVQALKEGAYDYVAKPLNLAELRIVVGHIMERSVLRREVKLLRHRLGDDLAVRDLIGDSTPMRQLKELVARAAGGDSPVLIDGESGTGKELVAAAIHRLSSRAGGPFIPVNCGSIPSQLLESEFFGHVRGAFTGAVADAQGLFRSAHGGTLFLDEVAELPPALQAKLLRVLQEGEVRPVGSTRIAAVDVRIVAATNRHLEQAVRAGALREDFFYRLNVIRITTPPLRARRGDIPALVHAFLRRLNQRAHRQIRAVAPEALAVLCAYDFPGNVRELENLVERAHALGAGDTITPDDLPSLACRADDPVVATGVLPQLDEALARFERELIGRALAHCAGDRDRAAHALGISSRTLYRRLREHRLA
jgi:DNA-binding NtrC family response regulator